MDVEKMKEEFIKKILDERVDVVNVWLNLENGNRYLTLQNLGDITIKELKRQ